MGEDGAVSDQRLPKEIADARERARRSLPVSLLVLLGIVAMYLPLPKRFVAVLPLAVAIVLTIQLLRYLAGRPSREKVWPAITLGIIGMLLTTLAVQGLFYSTVSAYEKCLAGAQTSVARADCEKIRDESPIGVGFLTE